jgi:hypothetical protein
MNSRQFSTVAHGFLMEGIFDTATPRSPAFGIVAEVLVTPSRDYMQEPRHVKDAN